jgi:hypothetical protein
MEPMVPQSIPAPTIVPPSGFVIVSLNVGGEPPVSTGPKTAPHVRGSVIEIRPVGAQGPVKPLKTYPLSLRVPSSTTSPGEKLAEQRIPPAPHSMPGPVIVPPVGGVSVSIWPGGQTHRTARNNPHTSNAPTATVATARSAPRAAGVDIPDPVERARGVEDCPWRPPRPCNRSPRDCSAAPRENDDLGGRDDPVRGFGWPMRVGSETGCAFVRGGGIGGNVIRGSVSDGRYRGSSRRTITVGSIDSGIGAEPLARLMRTVGSVETTSEPSAGV